MDQTLGYEVTLDSGSEEIIPHVINARDQSGPRCALDCDPLGLSYKVTSNKGNSAGGEESKRTSFLVSWRVLSNSFQLHHLDSNPQCQAGCYRTCGLWGPDTGGFPVQHATWSEMYIRIFWCRVLHLYHSDSQH